MLFIPFMPEMVEPLLKGTKIHTCRTDEHNRYWIGQLVNLAQGVRTKDFHIFKPGVRIMGVQKVQLGSKDGVLRMIVDGRPMSEKVVRDFVRNDGFESMYDAVNYFCVKTTHGGLGFTLHEWHGKIIHFTNLKY